MSVSDALVTASQLTSRVITSAAWTVDAGADAESPAPLLLPPPLSLVVASDVLPSSAAEDVLSRRDESPPTLKTTLGVRAAGNGHAASLL